MTQEVKLVMTRKQALRLAWEMFWFATGTSRVGLIITDGWWELVGKNHLEEK